MENTACNWLEQQLAILVDWTANMPYIVHTGSPSFDAKYVVVHY